MQKKQELSITSTKVFAYRKSESTVNQSNVLKDQLNLIKVGVIFSSAWLKVTDF